MNNMKSLREAAGLSQSAVAKALSTTQQTYQRWETGKSQPPIDALQNMALLFKVPLSRIIGTPDGSTLGFEPNHYLITDDDSGFWGHLGIQLDQKSNSLWFPISASEQHRLAAHLSNYDPGDIVQAGTLNNRLLLFSMNAVNRVRFLEDACDQPSDDTGWLAKDASPLDDFNGQPTILYEAMIAVAEGDFGKEETLGDAVMEHARQHLEALNLTDQQLDAALIQTRIHLIDGIVIKTKPDDMSLLALTIEMAAGFGEHLIAINDDNECLDLINRDRIVLVDIPLTAYAKSQDQIAPKNPFEQDN